MFLGSSAVEQVAVNHRVGGSSPSRGAIFGFAMFLSVKSKTFLIGEYAVLDGASAILLATDPSFCLEAESASVGELAGISEGSPAGIFCRRHEEFFDRLRIKFIDPYNGSGGFGASSAQFVLLYRLVYGDDSSCEHLLSTYKALTPNICVSGADCILQYYGSNICFNPDSISIDFLNWSFSNLAFRVIKAPVKVSTHRHLANLSFRCPDELKECIDLAKRAFSATDEELLIYSVNRYYDIMDRLGLALGETRDLVKKIRAIPGVKAAKGCGALGADTIVIIYTRGMEDEIFPLLS